VLEALVEAAQIGTDWATPILDARRGEFFVGLFRRQHEGDMGCQPSYVPAAEAWLLRPEELGPFLTRRLPEGVGATCVVREHDRAALALRENLSSSFQWQTVTGMLVVPVARLAFRDYQTGKPQVASNLDAYYIRRSDAELNWKG
jgi:tRNA A37 threonylcarbamoyladenosine modification protein TsaB